MPTPLTVAGIVPEINSIPGSRRRCRWMWAVAAFATVRQPLHPRSQFFDLGALASILNGLKSPALLGDGQEARLLVPLFGVTLFVSAALLFSVQPMFAKMVLPLLGGSPAVWNTCMVFFQATLLAGYAYAHVATASLGLGRQAVMHVALSLTPFLVLPIAIPREWTPPAEGSPVLWLLALLVGALGLPFFVLSASAPLLQAWFTRARRCEASDPYVLYAASNLGSMTALVGYPIVVEPNLRLAEQSRLWAAGYGVLLVLVVGCAATLWRSGPSPGRNGAPWTATGKEDRPSAWRRLRWLTLSFVPASLMLGLTTYLSTDISPMPLLWVVPFSLYLLTFVLAFSSHRLLPEALLRRCWPLLVVPLVMTLALQALRPLWLLVTLHVLTFFLAAMLCHAELARSRPHPDHLTEFFLWLAAGGVLGGIFNALIAPQLFEGVVEYPLVLVLACLIRPSPAAPRRLSLWLDFGVPLSLGAVVLGLSRAVRAGSLPDPAATLLIGGVPALLCFAIRHQRIGFPLAVGVVMAAPMLLGAERGRIVHRERSFFGVYRVELDAAGQHRILFSGTTVHGWQSLDPDRAREPLAYFHRTSPIGQVFSAFSGPGAKADVAIVGLGTGSLACYGEPGQRFTFYEIDPAVQRIASDPRYFTFLRLCAPRIQVVLGDARRSLVSAPDGHYGLIVLDAFSSDAIPVHLLTREALMLYLQKLAKDGILAFHISNRHLDLQPVLDDLARDEGLIGLAQHDLHLTSVEMASGKAKSQWVALARRWEDLGRLADDPRWSRLGRRPHAVAWSDDFSNLLGVIRWR
jgi:hypothetical protein